MLSPAIFAFSKLKIFHTTKDQGNFGYISGANKTKVTQNRLKLCQNLNLDPKNCLAVNQVHSADIYNPTSNFKIISTITNPTTQADGIFTTNQNHSLFLSTADCLPIVLYNPNPFAIALVHAGWLGLDRGVLSQAIKHFKQAHCKPQNIKAYIGPGISSQSYIVESPQQANSSKWRPFIKQVTKDQYAVDIKAFAVSQLINLSLLKQKIHQSQIDTFTSKELYSHRQTKINQAKPGRFATIVFRT